MLSATALSKKQCGPDIDTPVNDHFGIHPINTDSQLRARENNYHWVLIDKKIKLKKVFDQLKLFCSIKELLKLVNL